LGKVIGYVILCLVVSGLVFAAWRAVVPRSHVQADMDRDRQAFSIASKQYTDSLHACVAEKMSSDACLDHWRTHVQPNLKQAESAWDTLQGQIRYEFAHREVPQTCQKANAMLQTAMKSYYSVEHRVVAAVVNGNPDALKQLRMEEDQATDQLAKTAKLDGQLCNGY
jgi:hypothetical protein